MCIYLNPLEKAFIFNHFRAADGNRTRDLRTTNATLYRLSHGSKTYIRILHMGYFVNCFFDFL